jgi:hypothetical protein
MEQTIGSRGFARGAQGSNPASLTDRRKRPSTPAPRHCVEERAIFKTAAAMKRAYEAERASLCARKIDLGSTEASDALFAVIDRFGEAIPAPKLELVQDLLIWLRARIRKARMQRNEMAAMQAGRLGAGGMCYVTDATAAACRRRLQTPAPAGRHFGKKSHRLAKHWVRANAIGEVAAAAGLVGFFVTATLSPEYHSRPGRGAGGWNGATPNQANQQFQNNWRRLQRVFGKTVGFRIREAHADGCPHWHLVAYVTPERVDAFLRALETAFGAHPLCKIEPIDDRKGLNFYLFKNLAGYGRKTAEGIELGKRADAYSMVWNSHAIQFFDIPGASTHWDNLRKISAGSAALAGLGAGDRLLRAAAIDTDYARFLVLLAREKCESADAEKTPAVLTRIAALTFDGRGKVVDNASRSDDAAMSDNTTTTDSTTSTDSTTTADDNSRTGNAIPLAPACPGLAAATPGTGAGVRTVRHKIVKDLLIAIPSARAAIGHADRVPPARTCPPGSPAQADDGPARADPGGPERVGAGRTPSRRPASQEDAHVAWSPVALLRAGWRALRLLFGAVLAVWIMVATIRKRPAPRPVARAATSIRHAGWRAPGGNATVREQHRRQCRKERARARRGGRIHAARRRSKDAWRMAA